MESRLTFEEAAAKREVDRTAAATELDAISKRQREANEIRQDKIIDTYDEQSEAALEAGSRENTADHDDAKMARKASSLAIKVRDTLPRYLIEDYRASDGKVDWDRAAVGAVIYISRLAAYNLPVEHVDEAPDFTAFDEAGPEPVDPTPSPVTHRERLVEAVVQAWENVKHQAEHLGDIRSMYASRSEYTGKLSGQVQIEHTNGDKTAVNFEFEDELTESSGVK